MGLIRSFSVVAISSLLLISLIIANFSLAISLSEKTQEGKIIDWNQFVSFSLLFSAILVLFLFLFAEDKTNVPVITGFISIVSSLPSLIIKFAFSRFQEILKPLATVFSGSYQAFAIFFGVGVVLVALGIGMKFVEMGFYISKFFSRREKQGVKEKAEEKQMTKTKMKSGK